MFGRIGYCTADQRGLGLTPFAFTTSARFARENPNTYGALLRAIIDATQYSSDPRIVQKSPKPSHPRTISTSLSP